MAKFPDTEAEIQALARTISAAFADEFAGLSGAPVTAAEFAAALDGYESKCLKAVEARATAKQITGEKAADLRKLKRLMRQVLGFVESKNLGDAAMARVGWGARNARRAATIPEQPLDLKIVKEGAGWLSLQWKNNRAGGRAKFYRVMRRGQDNEFQEVASLLGTEHNLVGQPRGENLEFRVVAVNKAGESLPSNSVYAVL